MTPATVVLSSWFAFAPIEAGHVQDHAMPPAAPRATQRQFGLTLGAGRGWLALNDNLGRDGQGAWTFTGRVTAGFARNWMVFVGGEGSFTSRGDSKFLQSAWLVGLQTFVAGRVSIRAGAGPTTVTETAADSSQQSVGPGWAWTLGLGLETWRDRHVALGLEATFTSGTFAHERWDMGGVNAVMSLF